MDYQEKKWSVKEIDSRDETLLRDLVPCSDFQCCFMDSPDAKAIPSKPFFFWDLEQYAAGLDRVYGGELYGRDGSLVMLLYSNPREFKYLLLTQINS